MGDHRRVRRGLRGSGGRRRARLHHPRPQRGRWRCARQRAHHRARRAGRSRVRSGRRAPQRPCGGGGRRRRGLCAAALRGGRLYGRIHRRARSAVLPLHGNDRPAPAQGRARRRRGQERRLRCKAAHHRTGEPRRRAGAPLVDERRRHADRRAAHLHRSGHLHHLLRGPARTDRRPGHVFRNLPRQRRPGDPAL